MRYVYKRYRNVQVNEDGGMAVYNRRFTVGIDSRYVDGDRLVLTFTDIVVAESVDEACEELWLRHNKDDRPDGRLGPSLSVGDVVVLLNDQDNNATPVAFAVEGTGWSEVPVPTNIDPRFWVEIVRSF